MVRGHSSVVGLVAMVRSSNMEGGVRLSDFSRKTFFVMAKLIFFLNEESEGETTK